MDTIEKSETGLKGLIPKRSERLLVYAAIPFFVVQSAILEFGLTMSNELKREMNSNYGRSFEISSEPEIEEEVLNTVKLKLGGFVLTNGIGTVDYRIRMLEHQQELLGKT